MRVLGKRRIHPNPNIPWLTNPDWALDGVAIASVWWDAGFAMVVFLAGLQDIPQELREAAMIDGANRWRVFWHVVLPLLRVLRRPWRP